MTKKKEATNHFVGKHSGYELIDGVYYIAPMYTDAFAKLQERTVGMDQFVKSVTRHVVEMNKELASEQQKLWQRLQEDLGIDIQKGYCYKSDGTIRLIEDTK